MWGWFRRWLHRHLATPLLARCGSCDRLLRRREAVATRYPPGVVCVRCRTSALSRFILTVAASPDPDQQDPDPEEQEGS